MKLENNNLKNKNEGMYRKSPAIDLIDGKKDEYTVLDRTDLEDIYDDFDWANSTPENRHQRFEVERVKNQDISIDDRFSNSRELNRYDDIAEIIENDQRKARNYKNFQKNNIKFYKSIEEQIFEETKRILNLEDLDAYQPESLDDIHLIGEKYQTINDSVNTIISVAAEKDKTFLDLISDESKTSNMKRPEFINLKNNVNDAIENEEVKEFKSEEIETIPPYNQELKDLNERLDIEDNSSPVPPPPPPIPTQTIPVVNLVDSKPAPTSVINNQSPPNIPIVPSQSTTSAPAPSITNITPPPEIIKPSTVLTDTEYEKIKNYINNYNKSQRDAIASGSENIKVSDALKVNLYKNFYLTQNDLIEDKKLQDKNLKNMINEYEKTLRDINDYEVKKEIREFEKKTVPFVSTVAKTKENLKNDTLNSQLVQSENKELKNKIKELEAKITETLKQKELPPKISNSNLKINDSESSIDSKEPIINKPIIPTIAKTESKQPQSPFNNEKEIPKTEISKNDKLQEVAKNTLKPFSDSKATVVSIENSSLKKPITFKEQTNLSIYSVTKNDNLDNKKVSMSDALNKKKKALFSSFNANVANSDSDKPQIFSLADALKKKK